MNIIYTQSIVFWIIILQFFIDVLFRFFIISRSCRSCWFFYPWNLTLSVFWYHTASCWFFQLLWVGGSLIYIVFIHLLIILEIFIPIILFDVKLTLKFFLVLMLFNYVHKNIFKRTISDCNIDNLQLFLYLLNLLKYLWNFEFRKNFKDQISIVPF